jgi:hypothetical protein
VVVEVDVDVDMVWYCVFLCSNFFLDKFFEKLILFYFVG